MTLNGQELVVREYHFDRGGNTPDFASAATSGTGAVDLTTVDGAAFTVGAANDRGHLHFGDVLLFDIDDLLDVEFLYKVSDWDANAEALLGMGSAFNADPDAIAQLACFKVAGGVNGRNLVIETDDGVTDINDEATGIEVGSGEWQRAKIDFATGIQSIAPPGTSKPGKGSLQFIATDANQYTQHIRVNKHMDMSAYSGGLQLIIGARQVSGTPSGTPTLNVKSVVVRARQVA